MGNETEKKDKSRSGASPSASGKGGRWQRWRRRLGIAALVMVVGVVGLWIAVHRIQWLGPAIADGIRSVLGPGAVAWMEDTAYGLQDDVNVWRHGDDAPVDLFEDEVPVAPDPAPEKADAAPAAPTFEPKSFAPPFEKVATPKDGKWIPIKDPAQKDAPAPMFKAMVHPDERRPFAALAVVAIDLAALDIHLVAGTTEPQSLKLKLKDRPGVIKKEHRDLLVAAFNGGFKTTHGHYGMMVNDVELLPPRDIACTFAHYRDGSFKIAVWSNISANKDEMLFYRQTPPCLAENGKLHKLLHYHEYAKGWGATVSGDTVIRRSALGLSKDGKTLFYGLGEAMTAQSIARGMMAAGAHDVAELDVNFSYPRFLFYDKVNEGLPPMVTHAIIKHVDYLKYQYVSQSSTRDFFYLTRKPIETGAAGRGRDGKLAQNPGP